ncbi:Aldo/keto reductase [Rhizodiscina lignyota]|uniref:Aldo/keto reductase n=1 Tax=Rhizodiscina lignyota TaxID=1504668 RepID=A0A9P4ISB5_9PEZI|nr:Aldo/keto reductase [Rhizodiscina lignyota]
MAPEPKSNVPIVFGAMTIGKEGAEQARVHSLSEAKNILDIFTSHGHTEIDTSRVYGGGSCESYLAQCNWVGRGLAMETKMYPTGIANIPNIEKFHFTAADMRENLERSLKALGTDKVDMWYLHAPDRTTPVETTLKAADELYREGKFRRFGISNYMAWEVAQICELCEHNGWVKPVVYQGIYNGIHRTVEQELFPCLRKYGMAFYAYNPLAGGFLTDRYHRDVTEVEPGSRFDASRWQGKGYRARYWNDAYFDGLDLIREAAKKHGLTEAECALRWMTHHSLLKKGNGDAVIIGASSGKQLEQNLVDLEKSPLPDDVLSAFDQAWEKVRGLSWKYWH